MHVTKVPIIFLWIGKPATGIRTGQDCLGPILFAQQYPDRIIRVMCNKEEIDRFKDLFKKEGLKNVVVQEAKEYLWDQDDCIEYDLVSHLLLFAEVEQSPEDKALIHVCIKEFMQFAIASHEKALIIDTNVLPNPRIAFDESDYDAPFILPTVELDEDMPPEPEVWAMLTKGPTEDKRAVKRYQKYTEHMKKLCLLLKAFSGEDTQLIQTGERSRTKFDRAFLGKSVIEIARDADSDGTAFSEGKMATESVCLGFRNALIKIYQRSHVERNYRQQCSTFRLLRAMGELPDPTTLLDALKLDLRLNQRTISTPFNMGWETITVLHQAIVMNNPKLLDCLLTDHEGIIFTSQIGPEGDKHDSPIRSLLINKEKLSNAKSMLVSLLKVFVMQGLQGDEARLLEVIRDIIPVKTIDELSEQLMLEPIDGPLTTDCLAFIEKDRGRPESKLHT